MSGVTDTLLARIDERTEAIHDLLEKHIAVDEKVQADMETRMRSQERFRYLLLGAAALVTSGGGGLLGYLM